MKRSRAVPPVADPSPEAAALAGRRAGKSLREIAVELYGRSRWRPSDTLEPGKTLHSALNTPVHPFPNDTAPNCGTTLDVCVRKLRALASFARSNFTSLRKGM